MAYETFEKVEGIIRNIDRSDDCCSMILALDVDGEVTNVVVSGDTAVIDHVRLRPGMRVAAFYDTNLPTPAVYPPQYRAELVAPLRRGQQVMLDYFNDQMESADGSLKLNIGPMTNVMTMNGQPYTCSPENMELLVFYTAATFSMPAQTTPQRVIVMCGY